MVLTLPQLEVFLLVLARVAGIFIETPVLNARTIPATAKTILAIWISVILWFVVPFSGVVPGNPVFFVLLIANEVVLGFLIGFVCQILFAAIQAAGDIIDLQMGLSIATAFDPSTGAATSIVGKLVFYMAMVVFLILNGHHMVLSALHQSFKAIPAGTLINLSGNFVSQLINLGSTMLLVAVQLAAPALLLIFLLDFSFGIVSRVAPQVNVFMLGFQIKPTLGLIAILFTMPLMIKHIGSIIEEMMLELVKLMSNIKPG